MLEEPIRHSTVSGHDEYAVIECASLTSSDQDILDYGSSVGDRRASDLFDGVVAALRQEVHLKILPARRVGQVTTPQRQAIHSRYFAARHSAYSLPFIRSSSDIAHRVALPRPFERQPREVDRTDAPSYYPWSVDVLAQGKPRHLA